MGAVTERDPFPGERDMFERDYLVWMKRRLAKGGLPPHMVSLYSETVARLERQHAS